MTSVSPLCTATIDCSERVLIGGASPAVVSIGRVTGLDVHRDEPPR